ncbi:MAG: MTH1187 family thiamine-binding protein [Bacteroidales bacterium]|nr:MTH1187 family thiamine-binding protein [Bacteroidales bacterium]
MSVLLEYAMFPTDKGESVSQYVSQIIEMVRESGFPYQLTAMGTIVETSTIEESTEIVNKSYRILEPYSNRVYSSIKLDIQKSKHNRLLSKIKSIENKIGKVDK